MLLIRVSHWCTAGFATTSVRLTLKRTIAGRPSGCTAAGYVKAYLASTLPSAEDKTLAEQLALSVEGIEEVNNEILLDSNVPHNQARYDADKAGTDANITAMMRAQLLWNRLTHAHIISVSTNDGVVTLSGPVASEKEAREIVRVATNTR